MPDSYVPLITLWEEFTAAAGTSDVERFAIWVLEKNKKSRKLQKIDPELEKYFDQQTASHNFPQKSSEAAFMLWRLGKFIRFYTRPVLQNHALSGQDDFAILAHVDYKNICSKKEAIEANIIDSTTGIEIIKRLIKQGLLKEKANKQDRRERLISLTSAGRKKLYLIYGGFTNIQDVMANLDGGERELLITLLKSLDEFHTKNHAQMLHAD